MGLEKALLRPETPDGAQPIAVLFNPTEYELEGSSQFVETGVVGTSSPMLEYVGGNLRSLSMELFFDTYEERTDVRGYTDRIYDLLAIESSTHAPPVCTFTWGRFSFRCVLERVDGRFTLFLDDGTPVRASLNVTLKEVVDGVTVAKERPTESADHTTTAAVSRGDTLSAIAAREYGDPTAWRPIAEANGIVNPRILTPGQQFVIPPLAEQPNGATKR